jgi:hypothetical protein
LARNLTFTGWVFWESRVRNHATHALESTIHQLGRSKSVPM